MLFRHAPTLFLAPEFPVFYSSTDRSSAHLYILYGKVMLGYTVSDNENSEALRQMMETGDGDFRAIGKREK